MAAKSDQPANSRFSNRLRGALQVLALLGVYFLAGKFGLSLASINASASAVWPPTGIALAALLLYGNRLWPGVFLGAFLVNLTTQGSVATSLGIASGNTLEAVVGAMLVRRFASGANAFGRAQDIFKYAGLAAFLSTTLSATLGVTTLCLGGYAQWQQFAEIWLTWWLGDLVSNLIIAPAVVIWKTRGVSRLTAKRWAEAAALLLAILLTGYLLLLGRTAPSQTHAPLGFLTIPPLLWAAFRFGRRGAITSSLILSGIALWGTLHGFGPYVGPVPNQSLIYLQAFMGTSTLTALVLAGLLSERKRGESVLKESEARFRAFFDNAAVGAVQLDAQGRIALVNDVFCQITGYPREELLGMNPLELDHPTDQERDREHLAGFLAGTIAKYDVEKRYVRKDGRVIWVHVTVGIIRELGVRGLRTASIIEDITAHRIAQDELAQSRHELAAILESAMDAIITINDEQRIVLFNPAAERMFGIPAEKALGHAIDRFIPMNSRVAHRKHIEHFGETGQTHRAMGHLGALSGLRADGQEFPIEASISQVEVAGRKFFSVILRDITARRRDEEELRRARDELARTNQDLERKVQERTAKLREMIGELQHVSYAMVHDIRAPLRAMQNYASIAEYDLGECERPDLVDYLRRIRASAERMDALVLDALSYNRAVLEELPLEPVDLEKLVPEIIRAYPNLQPPKAQIRIEGSLPVVLGSKAGLTQCFSILLGNAVKFVAPGIQPQVRIWMQDLAQLSHPLDAASPSAHKDRRVRVWIEDNGIGIPQEWHLRIFDMFQRVEAGYEGTGIGLAIVRKTMERMAGQVGVESEPGKGSRFWLDLTSQAKQMAPPET